MNILLNKARLITRRSGFATFAASTTATAGVCLLFVMNNRENAPTLAFTTTSTKHKLSNWSNNHSCEYEEMFEPSSVEELQQYFERCEKNKKVKIIGSGLSPNGIGFCNAKEKENNFISLNKMKRIIDINEAEMTVTAECGITVGELVDELNSRGLMLENCASILSQTLGGFYQVGAHGTGKLIPPVEEQIVEATFVTPTGKILRLSKDSDVLFDFLKLNLGTMAIMTSVKLKVVKDEKVLETVQVMSRQQVKENHLKLLNSNKFLKYMWLPYTNQVVVTSSNVAMLPEEEGVVLHTSSSNSSSSSKEEAEEEEKRKKFALSKMHTLLLLKPETNTPQYSNFADLRQVILNEFFTSTDKAKYSSSFLSFVKELNNAECFYHENMVHEKKPTDLRDIMLFDCGGRQLVMEMCIPIWNDSEVEDVDFALSILEEIEKLQIPAPCPIEHRFTASSKARLSPAYVKEGEENAISHFGWIGVVMYIPEEAEEFIFAAFENYCKAVLRLAGEKKITVKHHWAKVEPFYFNHRKQEIKQYVEENFPEVFNFRELKNMLDPNDVLKNDFADLFLFY